jgi:hypothetical protein
MIPKSGYRFSKKIMLNREEEIAMSNEQKSDLESWKYAEKSMTWYGWGSPVGLGLFIISIGVFILLLHYAGIVR